MARWPRLPFPLGENRLARIEREARAAGRAILDLTNSNPTTAGLAYPTDALLATLADPRSLIYSPAPLGLGEAREAIAGFYAMHGVVVDPARIVLTASSSESYAMLFQLLCAPGDLVRVPQPSYPLFDYLAALQGVRLLPYPVRWDGAWHRDFPALAAEVGPDERVVVVVSPDNPTGTFIKRDERRALVALASARGLAILADEVFLDYPLFDVDPNRAPSLAGERETLAFALGGLSKSAGLPQLKLGWIVVAGPDREAAEAMARLELIADTYLSVATPVQHALPRILDLASEVRRAVQDRVTASRSALARSLDSTPCELLPAEGGWSAIVRLPALFGSRSDEPWAEALLAEEDVLAHPGAFYGFAHGAHLVLSLLTRPALIQEGGRRIAELVARRLGERPALR